jgi:hypothetical protein
VSLANNGFILIASKRLRGFKSMWSHHIFTVISEPWFYFDCKQALAAASLNMSHPALHKQ